MTRLRRSDCSAPGWTRQRRGRGFSYTDEGGAPLRDRDALARIGSLAIPPAWRSVWICPDPRGHLQATGIDAAGRKQYLYHDTWRIHRDRQKFVSMVVFGRRLPRLRRQVARDIAEPDFGCERILACAVRMLDSGCFRIGSDEYATDNGSHGLTTLRREHMRLDARGALFDYPAKSGQRGLVRIEDPDVLVVLRGLRRRRGEQALLCFKNGRGWTELGATAVNDYLKRHVGENFSAKDFRTWHGTVHAAELLARHGSTAQTKAARQRAIRVAVAGVADLLGNTPAVCRASYIDPRVFDRYLAGVTIPAREPPSGASARRRVECDVLRLLSG